MASSVLLSSLAAGTLWDAAGNALPGRPVNVFLRGSSTPVQVYSDAALAVPLSQPLVTSSTGTIPGFVAAEQSVDFVDVLSGARTQAEAISAADVQAAVVATSRLPTILLPPATGVAATDDANLAAAVAKLPATGGVIEGSGAYASANQYNFDLSVSVCLRGVGGITAGGTGGTSITYSGSAAPFISAKASVGFRVENLQVFYSNASFTGTLIDLSGKTGPAVDTVAPKVTDCLLTGSAGIRTAAQLILLNRANGAEVRRNMFANAIIGVRGVSTNADYSNGNTIAGCESNGTLTSCMIAGANGGWSIVGNVFEQTWTSNGLLGAPAGYKQLAGQAKGCTFAGNWMGDAQIAGTWIDLSSGDPSNPPTGIAVVGNQISGYPAVQIAAVKTAGAANGVSITGNQFDSIYQILTMGGATATWVYVTGNNYVNGTGGGIVDYNPNSGIVDSGGSGSGGAAYIGAFQHYGTLGFYGHATVARSAAYTLNAGAVSRNLASGATLVNVEQTLRQLITDLQANGLMQ